MTNISFRGDNEKGDHVNKRKEGNWTLKSTKIRLGLYDQGKTNLTPTTILVFYDLRLLRTKYYRSTPIPRRLLCVTFP